MPVSTLSLNGKRRLWVTAPVTANPAPAPAAAQQFSIANWGASLSPGFHQRGVWFVRGAVPAGTMPRVAQAAGAQFLGLRTYNDGSLKLGTLLLRDPAFAGGESRAYTLDAVSGSLPAGARAAVGNAGLTAALAGRDIKVAFAAVHRNDGANSVHGSGAFTASLATHAATATRWTLLGTGPAADVWQGWGMATDNAGGAADAHLKVNWCVIRWKAADSTTAGLQVMAEPALDWWSVDGKYGLSYDAVLLDGSTSIVSYPGVQHIQQSRWVMAVKSGNNAGQAPWIGAAQPTLHATFDAAYLIATGLISAENLGRVPAAVPIPTYVPCGNMEHRAAVDGTGEYIGRGVITQPDADYIMRRDPQAFARALVNAYAGLGVPYHYRSNRTRTRPGETTADIANTVIPLIMAPKPASFYDFTADGLPIAVNAYFDIRSEQTAQDGLIYSGNARNSDGRPIPSDGQTGVWQPSGDASHTVSYSYMMGLITGYPWLLEATIDLATNLAHTTIHGFSNNRVMFFTGEPQQAAATNPSTDTRKYTALFSQYQEDNPRALGWAQLPLGHAVGRIPNDHPAFRYLQAALAHNGDYIEGNLANMPADYAPAGAYYPESGLGNQGIVSPWMTAIQSMCANSCFLLTEDVRWQKLARHTFTWTARVAAAGRWAMFDAYRTMDRLVQGSWSTSNRLLPAEQQPFVMITPTLTASTGLFRNNPVYYNAVNSPPPAASDGDRVVFTRLTQGGSSGAIPAGATEGQVAYMRDVTNPRATSGNVYAAQPDPATTFRLAATPGGPALTWSMNLAYANMAWLPQSPSTYALATDATYVPPNDNDYVPLHMAAIACARQAADPAATQAMRDGAQRFRNSMAPSNYSPLDLVAV